MHEKFEDKERDLKAKHDKAHAELVDKHAEVHAKHADLNGKLVDKHFALPFIILVVNVNTFLLLIISCFFCFFFSKGVLKFKYDFKSIRGCFDFMMTKIL